MKIVRARPIYRLGNIICQYYCRYLPKKLVETKNDINEEMYAKAAVCRLEKLTLYCDSMTVNS